MNMDCASRRCVNATCATRSCSDGIRNGLESFIDCGSADCPLCGTNAHCFNHTQCASGLCQEAPCASAGAHTLTVIVTDEGGAERSTDISVTCP